MTSSFRTAGHDWILRTFDDEARAAKLQYDQVHWLATPEIGNDTLNVRSRELTLTSSFSQREVTGCSSPGDAQSAVRQRIRGMVHKLLVNFETD